MATVPTFMTGTALTQADLMWWIQSRPVTDLYQGTAQTGIVTGTWTAVTLDTEGVDRDNGHSGSSGRYIVGNTFGKYRVSGAVAFAGGSVCQLQAKLSFNGVDVPGSVISVEPGGVAAVTVVIPPRVVTSTSAPDYVELQCWQGSGASMNLTVSGGFQSHMLIEYLGS